MIQFPDKKTNRLAIHLKPAAERMVKKGHPWVFDGGITKQNKEGEAGDLAIIFDNKKNKFLACGLYDPNSPIRIKVLQVHKSANINTEWFANKIKTAFDKRKSLLATDTNSYRLIYGENDGLPSLIADVYADILVVKLYSTIWLPYLNQILPKLLDISKSKTMVLRLSRGVQKMDLEIHDGQVLHGELKNEVVIFREHGLSFAANVIKGHKTGYFLDHRHNRHKIGQLSKDKKVLDVFAYAGGFSVHALVGGAREVVSIDISAKALGMAKENAALNEHQGIYRLLAVDAFDGMKKLKADKEQFDIVIIDPPSFAKQESEVAGALVSYQKLARLGMQLVNKGGLLVLASCTARINAIQFFEAVEKVLQGSDKSFRLIEKTKHDDDHPISFEQGAYLKCGYYQCY